MVTVTACFKVKKSWLLVFLPVEMVTKTFKVICSLAERDLIPIHRFKTQNILR